MSEHHVYARLSGYGLTIFPRVPFRYERAPDGVELVHDGPGGRRAARLLPARGTFTTHLRPPAISLEEIADVLDGPALDEWRIETAIFTATWPEGFALISRDEAPGYDLVRDDGVLVYPQGPFGGPTPQDGRFVAPGQRLVKTGTVGQSIRWVDLAYKHEGQAWKQRHYIVPFAKGRILVTAQAPAKLEDKAVAAAESLALSIKPFDGDARSLAARRDERGRSGSHCST